MTELIGELIRNGLLQFGRFAVDGEFRPFQLHLGLLPSYPAFLSTVASESLNAVNMRGIDYLVCVPEALPLGVVVSQKSGIPLVYSRGRGETPAFDFVGAYDVGHPAVLIMNVLDPADSDDVFATVERAGRVGLEIKQIIAVIAFSDISSIGSVRFRSVMTLCEIMQRLVADGEMVVGQSRAVRNWLEARGGGE